MSRGIALLGLVVVQTATATRFLRGLAEHSPANVTNYTRCVFQRVNKVECSDGGAMVDRKVTYGEELWSKDEAFAMCDADPECDAVQKWKKNVGEGKSTRYKLCSLGKDACGRARLGKNTRSGCGGHGDDEPGADCSVHHVFTCLPYDEAPAMRSEGLFALCIIMIFACPFLIIIVAAVVAAAAAGCPDGPDPDGPDPEVSPVFTFLFCPFVVFWFLTFAFLSAYYGPAYNHSRDGACDPRVQPWGTHGAAIVGYGVIATGTLLCCIARPSLCCDDGCCVADPATPPQQREREKDLWQACSKGDVAAVRRLLKKGADVNQATENGMTPLWIACFKGHVDVARLLLDKGAEVDRATKNGATPLMIACEHGHVDAVRLLLNKGAEVDRAMNDGTTPLSIAKLRRHSSIFKLLAEHRAYAPPPPPPPPPRRRAYAPPPPPRRSPFGGGHGRAKPPPSSPSGVARAASCHDVLGVGRDARPAAIKKAYAKLALRFHPDRCTSPGATAAMARINEAYEQAMLQAKARYR